MINYPFRLAIFFLFISLNIFAQSEAKLASQARAMIGKTDVNSKKLNTLKSWDAVKYCAKKAGIITEKQSKSLSSMKIVNANGFKVKSHTRIPSGYIIGFFSNGKLIHAMISTGKGKAVGVNNKKAIGIGTDKKWEEVTLQQLKFKDGYGTFQYAGKTIAMVEKPASKILDINYYKKNKPIKQNTQNNGVVDRTPDEQSKLDKKEVLYANLKDANWSTKPGYMPDIEYDNNKAQFPEFKNWKQYAAKANGMLTTVMGSNGKFKFTNPNYKIRRYNDVFIFDKKDKIVLIIDNKNKPMTMKRVSDISKFNKLFEDEIKWDRYEGLKDKIKNAKQEFEQHKKDFKFKLWDEYAYYAQNLLDNIALKQSASKTIFTKRVNGDLLYFDRKTSVFIAANKNNEVLTMLKPPNGIEHYNSFNTSSQNEESIYDIIDLKDIENQYESTSAVLDPTPTVEWSKTEKSTAEKEYLKYKKDFPDLNNWKQYANKAMSLVKTKTLPNGKIIFENKNFNVKRYGNTFLFDTSTKIFLELDPDNLPVKMFKMKSLAEFNNYFKSKIKWSVIENKKDALLNAKTEFKENKVDFNFILWDEYAFHAQELIVDIVNKAKNNPKIHAQRNWKGHVIYYDERDNTLVAADRDNMVITMSKPAGDGMQTYALYASQLDPWETRAINQNALAEWNRLSAQYDKIPTNSNIYTQPGETFGKPNPSTNNQENVYNVVDMNESDNDDVESEDMDIQVDMSVYRANMPKKKTTDWSKKGNLPAVRVASLAYKENNKAFGTRITLPQYIAIAHYLKSNTPDDAETKILTNGNTVIYDFYSNLLGVYNPDGLPISLSKPVKRKAAFDEMN